MKNNKSQPRNLRIMISVDKDVDSFFNMLSNNSKEFKKSEIVFEFIMAFIPEFCEKCWNNTMNIDREVNSLIKERTRGWNNRINFYMKDFISSNKLNLQGGIKDE